MADLWSESEFRTQRNAERKTDPISVMTHSVWQTASLVAGRGCVGELGMGKQTEKPLHYQGTPIHRVVKDFMIQGGDFVNGVH